MGFNSSVDESERVRVSAHGFGTLFHVPFIFRFVSVRVRGTRGVSRDIHVHAKTGRVRVYARQDLRGRHD